MTRRLLLATLAAALVTGPMLEPALAKKPRAKMTARIDGGKFKGLETATSLIYATTGFR